jgi:hypothetical protein
MKRGPVLSVTLGMICAICALTCFFAGCSENPLVLPVYKTDQSNSSHPGYRCTTLTSGTMVYVNDFEEYSLQLRNSEPRTVVGRMEFGDGKVCAIDGQPFSAYVAGDVGSEMPAYAVFRNRSQPPFDWRKIAFQKMRFAILEGPAANKETTDPALIQEVLATLRDGHPALSASFDPANPSASKDFSALLLFSDQLPGLLFCVGVHRDAASGQFYLAENQSAKQWIKSSAAINQWLQTR